MTMSTFSELWEHYGCTDVFSEERPIHSEAVWKNLRELASKYSKRDTSTLPDSEKKGFSVSIEAKQSPGKGRGIFAAQDIKEGDQIWTNTHSAVFDMNGVGYKQLLLSLEPDFVCEALQCSYPAEHPASTIDETYDDENMVIWNIVLDLDEGCFCNDENWSSNDEAANHGYDEELEAEKELPGGYNSHYFAWRDIKAGEELVCSYAEFGMAWSGFQFKDYPIYTYNNTNTKRE